jgi:hypothetical protein
MSFLKYERKRSDVTREITRITVLHGFIFEQIYNTRNPVCKGKK